MSFINQIKQEIFERQIKDELIKFRLGGVFFSICTMVLQGSQPTCMFVTTSKQLVDFVDEVLLKKFGIGLSAFGETNKFVCEIESKYVKEVVNELDLENLDTSAYAFTSPQLKEFVAGVFIASAKSAISLKGAGSGYHIEFVFENVQNAKIICEVLASFDIFPKLIDRKGSTVIYIKSSDCICNLLALVGASKSLLALTNEIAARSIRNDANRKTNCDTHNIGKQIEAAAEQIAAIENLKNSGTYNHIDEKLKKTAEVRLQNPEAGYEELAGILGITKSGVVHRLRKITRFNDEK